MKLATSAVAEVLAERVTSRGRGFKYSINHGASEVLFARSYSNPEAFIRRGEGNKDRKPSVSSYCVAAISQTFGGYLYRIANTERLIHSLTIAVERIRRK